MNKIVKLALIMAHGAARRAFLRTGTAAAVEHLDVLRMCRPDTVIDVGGNKGQFALAVRSVLPEAHIVSFEPLPEAADVFSANLSEDGRVRLVCCALGNFNGSAEFHVASRSDSSSLRTLTDHAHDAYQLRESRVISVSVRRLDELHADQPELNGTVMLKIDVQGAEAEVIEGSAGILSKVRYVYAEAAFVELYSGQALINDLIEIMAQQRFSLRGMYNCSYTSAYGSTQADVLFEREAAAE